MSPSSYSSSLFGWFWSESIWVHPGYTWSDIETFSGVKLSDLYWAGLTALALIVIRYQVEKWVLTPLGLWLGLKNRTSLSYQKNKNPLLISKDLRLEIIWKGNKDKLISFDQVAIKTALEQLEHSLSQRQLERWIRRKANCERSTRLERFTESSWRMLFYAFAFAFGIFTLWDKPWFADSFYCFKDYPRHVVSDREWWYYNLELGFYLSLIVSQFTDVPKKDFMQMFIHHIVTIMLLTFSWTCNFIRIGTLVLVIHDFADIPLEAAKICRYLKTSDLVSNSVFGVFMLSWIFSRIGLLPYRVISYSSYYALGHVKFWPVYYIFNALLIALQILHVIWTFLILRIAYNAIYDDGVKDLREDSSLSSSPSGVEDDDDKKSRTFNPAGGDAVDNVRRRITTASGETNNHIISNGKSNGLKSHH